MLLAYLPNVPKKVQLYKYEHLIEVAMIHYKQIIFVLASCMSYVQFNKPTNCNRKPKII